MSAETNATKATETPPGARGCSLQRFVGRGCVATLYLADCAEVLPTLAPVDAVVTDPPYGLRFMGKAWDYDVPSVDLWRLVLAAAKPGAHLLSFAGTRTQHRMACAIEDAGFEIRDMIAWVYGSGFPKSLDVSKAIDRMDASDEQERRRLRFTAWVRSTGVTSAQIDAATGTNMGGHYTTAASQPAIMTREHLEACRHLFASVPEWVEREVDIRSVESRNMAEREVVGQKPSSLGGTVAAGERDADFIAEHREKMVNITAPATDAAKQWSGWGTALKPAWENIGCYQKPLTVAGYCAILLSNLTERIDTCRPSANDAAKSSEPSPAGLPEAKTDSVPASAATRREECPANETQTGVADGTSSAADTSASTSAAESTALSTILSWRDTLAAVYDAARTSTTSTAFETTIDWRTLSFCLSPSMLESTLLAVCRPSGASADALRAARFSTACFACLSSILALSVAGPAMSPEVDACRDVGARPALEPITLARKPLVGTVAENVLAHGTGAINVDGCRVGTEVIAAHGGGRNGDGRKYGGGSGIPAIAAGSNPHTGRWPANLIHDGSDEVVGLFPDRDGGAFPATQNTASWKMSSKGKGLSPARATGDSGSAARFFYTAKASGEDRGNHTKSALPLFGVGEESWRNSHPTVKPTALMRYLCRLVTPPGGIVLDPFMGSGSTGKAALREGFNFIGIERDAESFKIACDRIAHELDGALL